MSSECHGQRAIDAEESNRTEFDDKRKGFLTALCCIRFVRFRAKIKDYKYSLHLIVDTLDTSEGDTPLVWRIILTTSTEMNVII